MHLPKIHVRGGFRPKASEPLTNENLKIGCSEFFVFGGDKRPSTGSQDSYTSNTTTATVNNRYDQRTKPSGAFNAYVIYYEPSPDSLLLMKGVQSYENERNGAIN